MDTERWTGEAPDTVERARRARVRLGEVALWNLGGAGFVVRSARSLLLIDPYAGPSNPPDWVRAVPPAFDASRLHNVDAVLMTHEHDDHADPVSLAAIGRQTDALAIGPATCTAVAREAGVPETRLRTLEPGETVLAGDFRITAVPAHDPGAKGANGYVLELLDSLDGVPVQVEEGAGHMGTEPGTERPPRVTLAHYGDSLYFPGFAQLRQRFQLDALLVAVGTNPPGRFYYMDEADAARAARDTGARVLVPMHFNLWRATLIDPQRVATVAKWYAPQTRVIPAHYGRRITLAA
jgi:L-ascorbate metabolism protein UlaG (beta-lactamase superfamily)